ncbi:MAG: TetR/AcrR family transcriptional regulator [Rhizobiaceae bacterium]|nr:TetR/AcrR family transcriptional regulator [Rhizobiaceae bacterium]
MLLHDERGVAATSFVDVAKRAGIGAATVYRHFPTLGSLVAACGAHVWQEMAPPIPEQAPTIFEGLDRLEDRLQRLVDELNDFYRRGVLRLAKASADRHRIPELDRFLRAVEASVAALVREALKDESISDTRLQLVLALTDFPVWNSMQRIECDDLERRRLFARLLRSAIISAEYPAHLPAAGFSSDGQADRTGGGRAEGCHKTW